MWPGIGQPGAPARCALLLGGTRARACARLCELWSLVPLAPTRTPRGEEAEHGATMRFRQPIYACSERLARVAVREQGAGSRRRGACACATPPRGDAWGPRPGCSSPERATAGPQGSAGEARVNSHQCPSRQKHAADEATPNCPSPDRLATVERAHTPHPPRSRPPHAPQHKQCAHLERRGAEQG